MSFRIALSGMNAASKDLSVTAHNIANANTTGFKQSRAHFADVFPIQARGDSRSQNGSGVRVDSVQQQFGQGTVNFTDNGLDLAIGGEGFFTFSDNGALQYSRDGAMAVDRDGFLVNSQGLRMQVFPPTANGFDTGRLTDLQLSDSDAPPSATTNVDGSLNLPASDSPPAVATFDPNDPESYNHSTSLTVFDSLGSSHVATTYFVKTATDNTWEMNTTIDGNVTGPAQTLVYDDSGALTTPANGNVTIPTYTPGNGAADIDLTVDLSDSSQYSDLFAVNSLTQDGYTSGRLVGLEVTGEGVVQARFTNGQATPLGQVALASFSNPQGLQQSGDTTWAESFNSGAARLGQAGSSGLGMLQSGALENSNVDLTEQLVNMITAQRNFQANAQMIQTSDAISQTVINIR